MYQIHLCIFLFTYLFIYIFRKLPMHMVLDPNSLLNCTHIYSSVRLDANGSAAVHPHADQLKL